MNITPDWYTEKDGGRWLPWTFGELRNVPSIHITNKPTASFKAVIPKESILIVKGKPHVDVESLITLHSFAVGNPIGQPRGSYARWDCRNGWTTTQTELGTIDEGK